MVFRSVSAARPSGRSRTIRARAARVGFVSVIVLGSLIACSSSKHAATAPPTSTASVTATSTASPSAVARPSVAPVSVSTVQTGSVHQTVPARVIPTESPVPLTSPVTVAGKVSFAISKTAKVTAVGQGPGEFSGPAYAVTITVTNSSAKAADLSAVVVNMTDKAAAPFTTVSGSPSAPLPRTVAAGAKATGVYVFALNASHSNPVTISVSYTATSPVVLFTGTIA